MRYEGSYRELTDIVFYAGRTDIAVCGFCLPKHSQLKP